MRKQHVRIYANAARPWSTASRTTDGSVLLISPYITSSIAQTLARQNRASIYTLFDAELFARGSSSLSSLERLLRTGNDIYSIPNLHAKVMLFGKERATVGSQNLTQRGTVNKEATAAFTDPRVVAKIHGLVKPWLEGAEPITLPMIAAMKKSLPALKRTFKKFDDDAKATTIRIVAEAKAARERESGSTLVVKRIRAALARYPRPASSIASRVRELRVGRSSLMPESALDTFTWWQIAGKQITLERAERYLCLNEQSGMVGWGRVMNRRISFIDNSFLDELVFDERQCNLQVTADWATPSTSTGNLSIKVKTQWNSEICELRCAFEVDRLRILKMTDLSDGAFSERTQLFRQRRKQLEDALLPILLKPFKYKQALTGSRPDKFVGPPGTLVTVDVVQLASYEILVFRAAQHG